MVCQQGVTPQSLHALAHLQAICTFDSTLSWRREITQAMWQRVTCDYVWFQDSTEKGSGADSPVGLSIREVGPDQFT